MKGKVYIASMNMYGQRADPLNDNTIILNVTSAQGKNNKNRRDFSPMTKIEGGYKGYWNFESYWQSGKVYEDIPIEKSKKWWKNLEKPRRRYPNSKNKNILYALFDGNNEQMDYITSRKKVYVPEYYDLIKNREMLLFYKNMVNNGENITIYDFDGSRKINKDVECVEVDVNLLINKINDLTHPFGHGYIVAAALLNILPEEYII